MTASGASSNAGRWGRDPTLTVSLLIMWCGAPAIFAVTIVTFSSPSGGLVPWIIDVIAWMVFGSLFAFRRRLSPWTLDITNVIAYTLISAAFFVDETATSPYGLFFVWPPLVASYFLPTRRVIAQVVLATAFHGVAVLALSGGVNVQWIMISVTIAFTGCIVTLLHGQVSRLAIVVRSTDDAVITVDRSGRIKSWNAGAVTLFGYSSVEVKHQSITLLGVRTSHPSESGVVGALLDIARSDVEIAQHAEDMLQKQDGSTVNVSVAMSSLRDGVGQNSGAAVIIRDVSERKKLEAELQQAQKLESVGRLAAGVAHEINTPIQFIDNNVRFLGEGIEQLLADDRSDLAFLQEEMPATVAQVLEGVGRIATIVQAMKIYAHGDAGAAPTDINAAIQATLTIVNSELRDVADVETDFGALPLVQCYAAELNHVFLNLLTNAAHAIRDSSPAGDALRGTISVTTHVDGDAVVISVKDSGTGIPFDIQEKVFDPFFTTRPVGSGTGQGLTLSRSIVVDRHQGGLTFESTPGKGSTFHVRLPTRITGPAPARVPAA